MIGTRIKQIATSLKTTRKDVMVKQITASLKTTRKDVTDSNVLRPRNDVGECRLPRPTSSQ